MLFALPVTNQIQSTAQQQAGSWTLTANLLAGADAQPLVDPNNTGGGLLGPTPQAIDVLFGYNGDAVIRGTVQTIDPGGAPVATPATSAPPGALLLSSFTPQTWLVIAILAAVLLHK